MPTGRCLIEFEPGHGLMAYLGTGEASCSCGKWEAEFLLEDRFMVIDGLPPLVRLREHLKEGFYKHIQQMRE